MSRKTAFWMSLIGVILGLVLAATLSAARTVTVHNSAEFSSWLSSQQVGDVVLFDGNVGTLAAPITGTVSASNVVFDVAPNAVPNVLYYLSVTGAGFEARNIVTDFTGATPSRGIVYQLVGKQQKLSNVWVQTANVNSWAGPPACSYTSGVYCQGREPVLASTDGVGTTIFGGAFFNGHHGIYIQNVFANGPKIIDSVILAYDKGCATNCTRFALHGYTESGHSEGVEVHRSIFYGPTDRNLDVMLGGSTNAVPFNNTYDTTLFYNIKGVQVGYSVAPEGVKVTGNTFVNSMLSAGARVSVAARPWIVRDNTFIGSSTYLIVEPTDAAGACTSFGIADVLDGNSYQVDSTGKPKITHKLCSPTESNSSGWTLPTIRTKLAAHGCVSCDANSVTTTGSSTPIVKMVMTGVNRASFAVVTAGVTTTHTVNVDLSAVVAAGTPCKIMWAEDNPYSGTPRWQGVYTGGTIPLQVNGEFEAFMLSVANMPTSSPTVTSSATQSATPTSTPTWTYSPTETHTPTATYTPTSTPTATNTPTYTPTATPTMTDLEQQDRIRGLESRVYTPTP